jgi:hypothetical protein
MIRPGYGLDVEVHRAVVVADYEEGFLAAFGMHRECSIRKPVTSGLIDDSDNATRSVDEADG